MKRLNKLLSVLGESPMSAAALRARIGVSPATLSRLIAGAPQVIRYGRGKATTYARSREIPGINRRFFPVIEIDAHGRENDLGRVLPVHGGYLHLTPDGTGHFSEGLPWWLSDMAPQGFLGRAFAAGATGGSHDLPPLPPNPADWADDLRLAVIGSPDWNPPGNLIVGDRPVPRPLLISEEDRDFPRLAKATLEGEPPGSSAGGEQPKFLAWVEDATARRPVEVLVKFSWGETEAARERRADLLVCEHLAAETLIAAGVPAVASRLARHAGVTFLIMRRADRTREGGRAGLVSLAALDDAFVGARRSWTHSAAELAKLGRLRNRDALEVRRIECFARLIANTDRHLGNLSFFREGLAITGLFPVYDMLPMRYAPTREGALPRPVPTAEMLTNGSEPDDLAAMRPAAFDFWNRAAAHPMTSSDFRDLARIAAAALTA